MWPSQTGIDHLDLMFSTQKKAKEKTKIKHTHKFLAKVRPLLDVPVRHRGKRTVPACGDGEAQSCSCFTVTETRKKNQEVIFLMSALFLLHKGCNSSLECFLLLFIECWDWKHLWWRSGYTSGPCFIYKTCINGKIKSGLFMYFPV